MILLALDSTENTATVALTRDRELLGQATLRAGLTHSETLLPLLETLRRGAHLTYDDIDLFVTSAGPGSFTGVRIGAATLKGLAFGQNKPCLGVSACEALAYNLIGFDGLAVAVMDARRGQLYNAIFAVENSLLRRLTPDRVIAAEDLIEELRSYSQPIRFAGGGYAIAHEAAKDLTTVRDTPALLRHQNAYSTALAGLALVESGTDLAAFTDRSLSPVYLRPSQAERTRNGG
ncbi:MAG: tRNA (adenosine(37)-N6)-threonylcarbamoyltransferase complex dimerization subunit type 1 TsaB [Ruminococcaceae bacterium]|nr:tRNA (adenosine(37)-N6)-threonylcarbamoyltransferase complex dimerization subunit type 1 TsaB [Oscillospiraceae bacterium]